MSNAEARIDVRGMTCNGCRNAVQNALLGLPGVRSATVDLDTALALVGYEPELVSMAEMLEVISDLGYTAKAESVDTA